MFNITPSLGVNPLVWGDVKQTEFVKAFKGKASTARLKEVYKNCKEFCEKNK